MTLIYILLMASSGMRDGGSIVRYNLEGQEGCEMMCFRCISRGEEPEDCAEKMMFRMCCRQNGGRTEGCGCRTAL
jgi:hypothetical protein